MRALDRLRGNLSRMLAPASMKRAIDAASGRRWGGNPTVSRVGAETLGATGTVRDRARYACLNDPLAANALSIYQTALVGTGISVASGHPDAGVRRTIDDGFRAWCERNDFAARQSEVVQALVRDGEHVEIMGIGDNGDLSLQPVPAELLDASLTRDLGNGRYIAGGVEFDGRNRPIAYHIAPSRPTDLFAGYAPPARFDRADVLHVFRSLGSDQPRGLSWFAPVLLGLHELNQTLDALGVTAKIQAMLTAFLVDQNGTATGNPFGEGQQAGDLLNVSLEPGTVRVLPSGWDVRFSTPQQMAQSIEFATLSIRTLAAGLQIPEFLFSGDMRGANFSSMRSALVQFRIHIEAHQFITLVPNYHARIFRRWLTLGMLNGTLDFRDFEANRDDYFRCEWYPPAFPWVDPEKDIAAEALAVENGFKSRRQVVKERGYDIERLDAEIAADRTREQSMGVAFGTAKPAVQPTDPKKDQPQ